LSGAFRHRGETYIGLELRVGFFDERKALAKVLTRE
jgi:hypothetical protein